MDTDLAGGFLRCPRYQTPPVVHIVDDDGSLRAGLASLLLTVGLTARTYGSTQEFLNAEQLHCPGCIVLDIRLPGANGLDFQEELAAFGINLPMVLMTGHGDIPMSVRAMKAGAIDFLPKPFRDQDIIDAVTAAIKRDRLRRANENQAGAVADRYTTLSPREREIMALVTAGKMNKQIAAELHLSEVVRQLALVDCISRSPPIRTKPGRELIVRRATSMRTSESARVRQRTSAAL